MIEFSRTRAITVTNFDPEREQVLVNEDARESLDCIESMLKEGLEARQVSAHLKIAGFCNGPYR